MKQYKKGTNVFLDFAFSDKPDGRVVEVIEPGEGNSANGKIRVKVTETVGAYRKGEILTVDAMTAVPKAQELKLQAGQYFRRVNTQYEWVK